MPYEIRRRGKEHCVAKKDGEIIACHPTREQAVAQMQAILINEQKRTNSAMNRFIRRGAGKED